MNEFPNGRRAAGFGAAARLLLTIAIALATTATRADVGGGPARGETDRRPIHHSAVLPAEARPFGYSLADMVRLTAAFNVGDRSGPPPNSPFQVLYVIGNADTAAFTVRHGTFLFVPVLYSDNSAPLLGHFPANVLDRRQLLPYWFSQNEIGIVATDVTVDGVTVPLGARYVQGAVFAQPLPSTATQYVAAAAFIEPLRRGVHSVAIHSRATGDALRAPPFDQVFPDGVFEFTSTYTVTVQ